MYYLEQARSSLLEVETQLLIAKRLSYIREEARDDLLRKTTTESKMLLSLMRSLQSYVSPLPSSLSTHRFPFPRRVSSDSRAAERRQVHPF